MRSKLSSTKFGIRRNLIGRSMVESKMTARKRGKLLPRKRMPILRTSQRTSLLASERSASPKARKRVRTQPPKQPRTLMT